MVGCNLPHRTRETDSMSDDAVKSRPEVKRAVFALARSGVFRAAAICGCVALAAWTQATSAQSVASTPSTPESYLPSISDFMIATIQPRHVRLWIAAQSKDWPFAAYELGNLKGAFGRLGRAHPTANEIPLQQMIASVTEQPFEDLGKAIQAKDVPMFARAYGDLTSACNACHQATNHGVVVIGVPAGSAVSDQDFAKAAP